MVEETLFHFSENVNCKNTSVYETFSLGDFSITTVDGKIDKVFYGIDVNFHMFYGIHFSLGVEIDI